MKTKKITSSMSFIDDSLISEASNQSKIFHKTLIIKFSALAASFAIIFSALIMVPGILNQDSNNLPIDITNNTTDTNLSTNPAIGTATDLPYFTAATESNKPVTSESSYLSKVYKYSVESGKFSTYIGGKVIAEEKISSKIDDTAVIGGWKNNKLETLTSELLRAEIYLIEGVSEDTAVALKFIDKGDALTTNHYYVILNPNSDLTKMGEYIIGYNNVVTASENSSGEINETVTHHVTTSREINTNGIYSETTSHGVKPEN